MTTTDATSDTSQRASNRVLGIQFFAEQDRLRGGPAPELCASEYQAIIGGNPPTNREGHEAFAKGFYAGFSDISHTAEDVMATDDAVFVRFILRGTHDGNFFGIPATGRLVTVSAHALLYVSDGRVHLLKALFDEAGLLRQLKVLPS